MIQPLLDQSSLLVVAQPGLEPKLPLKPAPMGFPGGSAGKESTCSVGDLDSLPGLGRSPGEGKDYPLQYSGLQNSMDCIVHRVAKSRTRLSDFHFQTCPCSSLHWEHEMGAVIIRLTLYFSTKHRNMAGWTLDGEWLTLSTFSFSFYHRLERG